MPLGVNASADRPLQRLWFGADDGGLVAGIVGSVATIVVSNQPMIAGRYSYTPSLPTNRNLDSLLERHFGLTRAQCYLTNLFPFIKPGGMTARIPRKDLLFCAQTFTLQEVQIVDPPLVICLGMNTFCALRSAAGYSGSWTLKMGEAVNAPFQIGQSHVHCVAHTGARGTNNRGREQVETDWKGLASSLNLYTSKHLPCRE